MSSTLTLEAPLAEAEAVPTKIKGTLLVVDDEEGPRMSLRVIFKDEYNILFAHDGLTAVEIAQKQRVDVAVCDIRMAGMSGIEVLERLKFVDPNIEVVMMTAFETADTMRQALRLRACDYLNKPFDLATMRAAVARAMERRTLAAEIQTNTDRLSDLVKELEDVRVQQQSSQNRSEIYAHIIHDLNGPLTVISGFIQLLSQRIGEATQLDATDTEFVKDRLKIITRQVTRCIEISRRYLANLRHQPEELPRVGVNQILSDLEEQLKVHPSSQNNQLSIARLPQDVGARINGTDLMQLLLNLAVNGFQCTSHGHDVEVRAELLTEPLDLGGIGEGTNEQFINRDGFQNIAPLLAFAVRDSGPGIPTDVFTRMFDPFFTTKSSRHGTGLGLNIVIRMVKQANGAIRVRTLLGQGTTFTVYVRASNLPVEPPAAA